MAHSFLQCPRNKNKINKKNSQFLAKQIEILLSAALRRLVNIPKDTIDMPLVFLYVFT